MDGISVVLDLIQTYEPESIADVSDVLRIASTRYAQAKGVDGEQTTASFLPNPIEVALILAHWQIPAPIVGATVLSLVFPQGQQSDFQTYLPLAWHAQVATQLARINSLFARERLRYALPDLKKNMEQLKGHLLREPWPSGLLMLEVALFLATLRQVVLDENLDKKSLVVQAKALMKPICEHFGLWTACRELRNFAFQCENPARFADIHMFLERLSPPIKVFVHEVHDHIKAAYQQEPFAQYTLHDVSSLPYKVARLQEMKGDTLPVNDLVSFVAILPNKRACHTFSQIVQRLGSPGKSYRNYLDYPKKNGYSALHLQISSSLGPITFYICTPEGYQLNQFGDIYRWQRQEKNFFVEEELRLHAPLGKIFVFARNGKPLILPEGATLKTFAGEMHQGLDLKVDHALIHGPQRSMDQSTILENGDIIEMEILHPKTSPLTRAVNHKRDHPKYVRREPLPSSDQSQMGSTEMPLTSHENNTIFDAIDALESYGDYRLHWCNICKPYPGVDIAGHVTLDNDLTIHSLKCHIYREYDTAEWYRLKWRRSAMRQAMVKLELEIWDEVGRLKEITGVVATHRLNICENHSISLTNGTAHIMITMQKGNKREVEAICATLQQFWWVHSVNATYISPDNWSPHSPTAIATNVVQTTVGEPANTILNPYSPTPAGTDAGGLFYGRTNELQEISETITSEAPCRSVILWGQQRIGKSSMLLHLEKRMQGFPILHTPIVLSMLDWTLTTETISNWLGQQIEQALEDLSERGVLPIAVPRWRGAARKSSDALVGYVEDIQNKLRESRLIIMLDELQALTGLIQQPQIQDCMQSLKTLLKNGISFIFSGWGLPFNRTMQNWFAPSEMRVRLMTLDMLDRDAARDLICEPVKSFLTYESEVIDRLYQMTRGHPYFLHLLCHQLTHNAITSSRSLVRSDHLDLAVQHLFKRGAGSLNYLMELGEFETPLCQAVLSAFVHTTRDPVEFVPESALAHFGTKQVRPHAETVHAIVNAMGEMGILERDPLQDESFRVRLQERGRESPRHSCGGRNGPSPDTTHPLDNDEAGCYPGRRNVVFAVKGAGDVDAGV